MLHLYNLTQELNILIKNDDIEGIKNHCKNNFSKNELGDILYNTANYISRDFWKHKLAIEIYKEALKYNKYDETIYNNLATTYKDIWDFENALKNYKESFNLDNKNPKRALRLAELSAFLNNNTDTKLYLEKFFELWWDDFFLKDYCKYSWKWSKELLNFYENKFKNKKISFLDKVKDLF